MSRLFQALVVAGAAISASACGGKSSEVANDDDDGNPMGGSSGASGAAPTGGASPTGGVGGAAPTGGMAGTSTGGTGGPVLPAPGRGAQWDCSLATPDPACVSVLGTTASSIPEECPVDATRPRTAADCASGELFTCVLGVTPSSELLLVNCYCQPSSAYSCESCTNLAHLHGEPAFCDGVTKVCACAYTGILR
ncbi:MAG TPA: hypothetical protein VFZ53_08650 [Polyangiaceae bacterium]